MTGENAQRTVEQLEALLRDNPENEKYKMDLVEGLYDRNLYRDMAKDGAQAEQESDLTRIKELLAELPEDAHPYYRAFIAYSEYKDEDAIHWIGQWAEGISQRDDVPLSTDEYISLLMYPFHGASIQFWNKIAEIWEKTGKLCG